MTGWEPLTDGYRAAYRARGVCAGSIGRTTSVRE
jgi:hypothetical protein